METQSQALVLANEPRTAGIQPRTIDDVQRFAKIFIASGLFSDTEGMAQACVKIMYGQEMGVPALEAMRNIDIIKGRITIKPHLWATLIKRHPRYDFRVPESTDQLCRIVYLEDGEVIGESLFTLEMAERAGLCKIKDGRAHARGRSGNALPWEAYTEDMLYARAMARGARRFCPDVLGGAVYMPDEIAEPEYVDSSPVIDMQGEAPAALPEHATMNLYKPLRPEPAPADQNGAPDSAAEVPLKSLQAMCSNMGLTNEDRETRLRLALPCIGHEVETFNDLTASERRRLYLILRAIKSRYETGIEKVDLTQRRAACVYLIQTGAYVQGSDDLERILDMFDEHFWDQAKSEHSASDDSE